MEQIADNFPLNAGVNVAFPSRKVTFTYSKKPTSKKSLGMVYMCIIQLWYIINILAIGILLLSSIVTFILQLIVFIQAGNDFLPSVSMTGVSLLDFLPIFLMFGYFFGIPLIPAVYLTWKYKKFSKIFPKVNYFMANLFEPKKRVVVKNLKKPVFVLPLFKNVFLGYEVSGDFSSFLKNVEVKEFGFKCLRKDAFKEEKEVPITTRWKAIFSFTKVPKCGELIINFL